MNKQDLETTGQWEIVGSEDGLIDTTSEDFKALQNAIIEHVKTIPPARRKRTLLLSLRFQMEAYLKENKPKEVLTLGYFLKKLVAVLEIKHKKIAAYIDCQESNLSALLNDNRKINTDLAMKFGEIFGINPIVFLHIQSKNELLEISYF